MSAVIKKNYLVITNCTGRKRASIDNLQLSKLDIAGTPQEVARHWVGHLSSKDNQIVANHLYMGRSFSDAKKTAKDLHAPLAIVSAGLGLILGESKIPSYDLTVSAGSNNVLKRFTTIHSKSQDWWIALNNEFGKPNPIKTLMTRFPKAIVLIALPSTYLEMVAQDFDHLSLKQNSRLRIFTSELGRARLSRELQLQVMPYDERLEVTGFAGTRSDFPQRALRHFVEELRGEALDLDEAKDRVIESLSLVKRRLVPKRAKRSDEDIVTLLNEYWSVCSGRRGRLLRYLRDEKGIACEQARFGRLWKHVYQLRNGGVNDFR
jgi:hypothetical protein